MLSELFSPHLQKFNRYPIYTKILLIVAGVWLLAIAWPVMVAILFGLIVFSTMQDAKTRVALAALMLVPALIMEGYWASSLMAGVVNDNKSEPASPSKVALVDHNNQIQGAQTQQTNQARVISAISGDTIEVEQQGQKFRIKLVGISSPEPSEGANSAQCFGDESKLFLHSLLENRLVEVIEDKMVDESSQNGDLLRYIRMSDGTKVNELLLEAGLAREDNTIDYEQKDIFIELAQSANQNNKGLWATCAENGQPKVTPVPSVVVTPTPRATNPVPTGINPVNPNQ